MIPNASACHRVTALVVAFLLAGCMAGDVGAPCKRTGDGFQARDNCRTMCLAFPISCPGDTSVTPNVCAGRQDCVHGACPAGQVCIRVNVDRSFCVPDTICPTWRAEGVAHPVLTPDAEVKRVLGLE